MVLLYKSYTYFSIHYYIFPSVWASLKYVHNFTTSRDLPTINTQNHSCGMEAIMHLNKYINHKFIFETMRTSFISIQDTISS